MVSLRVRAGRPWANNRATANAGCLRRAADDESPAGQSRCADDVAATRVSRRCPGDADAVRRHDEEGGPLPPDGGSGRFILLAAQVMRRLPGAAIMAEAVAEA